MVQKKHFKKLYLGIFQKYHHVFWLTVFWLTVDHVYGAHRSSKIVLPSDAVVTLACTGTFCDVCTVTKSPNDAFLRMHPCH